MRTKNKTARILFYLLLAAFSVSNAKESTDPTASAVLSPYPVYDSGAWADPLHDPEIYWIDNNRVLFKAVKDNDKKNISRGPFNLSIWEIGKGVKPYTDYYQSVTACIQGDIIHRTQKDAQGNVRRFYGKFGEEKPFEFPKTKGAFFDQMNCRPNTNSEILVKRQAGRAIRPLLDRHGYLDTGPIRGPKSSENTQTILYRPGHPEGMTLPVRIGYVSYYAFKDAYFFRGLFKPDTSSEIRSLWPAGTTDIMGWLHPDGRVEPVLLSKEPWPDKKIPTAVFGSGNIVLLRDGFLILFGLAKGPYDAGTLGGYLLRDNKLTKVVGGYINSVTVSPDGCKVAFVHYPYLEATLADDPAPIRLKAVDFCQPKEEKNHGQ